MPTFSDPTKDPQWLEEQQNRLLGFELFRKMATLDTLPVNPGDIHAKTGVGRALPKKILRRLRSELI